MGMNIDNPNILRLAHQLAEATGEEMGSAIQHALEEKLERVNRIEERKRRIRAFLDTLSPPPPGLTSDHSDLYDEWGLPK